MKIKSKTSLVREWVTPSSTNSSLTTIIRSASQIIVSKLVTSCCNSQQRFTSRTRKSSVRKEKVQRIQSSNTTKLKCTTRMRCDVVTSGIGTRAI